MIGLGEWEILITQDKDLEEGFSGRVVVPFISILIFEGEKMKIIPADRNAPQVQAKVMF